MAEIIITTKEELTQLFENSVRKILAEQSPQQNDVQDIVPIETAMEITNLARQTIYGLVCKRKIPFIKKSRKLYFSRKKLISWIQEMD